MRSRNHFSSGDNLSLAVAASLAVAVMVLWTGNSEALAQKCKTVHGHFIDQVLVPPGGNLPGGSTCVSGLFCVSGRAIGGLHGDFVSTNTSFVYAPNFGATQVAFFTADVVLHTRDGDLMMEEDGASNTTGHGDLGDVDTVVPGSTGKWVGATGRLRVWGNLTVTESDVTYEGEICRP